LTVSHTRVDERSVVRFPEQRKSKFGCDEIYRKRLTFRRVPLACRELLLPAFLCAAHRPLFGIVHDDR
jgi:hypothetical protein